MGNFNALSSRISSDQCHGVHCNWTISRAAHQNCARPEASMFATHDITTVRLPVEFKDPRPCCLDLALQRLLEYMHRQ